MTIEYSAQDWELFSDMRGVKACARRLNKGINKLLTEAKARIEADPMLDSAKVGSLHLERFEKEHLRLDCNERFGSGDTEPRVQARILFERELGLIID